MAQVLLARVLLIPLGLFPLLAAPNRPREESLKPGTTYYFRNDSGTGADYLRLSADGSFSLIDVEHMYRRPVDHGTWRAEGSHLSLDSEERVVDLVSPPYRVSIFFPDEVPLLPRLKAAVLALHSELRGRRVTPEHLSAFRISEQAGKRLKEVAVAMDFEVEFGVGSADPSTLLRLSEEIDRYLDRPEAQRIFPYQCFSYRGHTYLVPLVPGADAVSSTPESIRAEIDKSNGGPPSYTFLLVTQDVFEQGVGSTYPFKFLP